MAEHTLYGKRRICYTEVTEFTDFQGVGRDPLYKRYDTVNSVIEKYISPEYRDFLAHPIYSDEDQILWYVRDWNGSPSRFKDLTGLEKEKYTIIKDKTVAEYKNLQQKLSGEDKQILTGALRFIDDEFIFCYDDKVVLVAWGMVPDSNKHLVKGTVMHDLKLQATHVVNFIVGEGGNLRDKFAGLMSRPDGATLVERDLPEVFPKEGYIFKGWQPNPIGMKVTEPLTFTAQYEMAPLPEPEKVHISFMDSEGGLIHGTTELIIDKGSYLDAMMIPVAEPHGGYAFTGWDNDVTQQINEDIVFKAMYVRTEARCIFDGGEHGSVVGINEFSVPLNTTFDTSRIPQVKADKKYIFIGWDKDPATHVIDDDTTFVAQYEKDLPWYKKLWKFLTGKGCLKWLLWILLILLALWLLFYILKGCDVKHDPVVRKSRKIETPSGRIIDDNGPIKGVIGDDGKLPDRGIVAPIVGDDGTEPPIISNPGAPDIVANRLVVFFEDADADLQAFIKELNNIYPQDICKAIGFDRNIPMITLMVAEDQRNNIRENLPYQLSGYDFFVFDESIYEINRNYETSAETKGWHLDAIDLNDGWKITKGNPDIVVAVVDDGIDAEHEMFQNRIVKPYNVFTQNNCLSTGDGHGTHVAGLAVGSDKKISQGISGVAPKCKLMPVQVFDNGSCTFSTITSGIIYAIHNGADVINVSIGPNFSGMDALPEEDQEMISREYFKNEEIVWKRIISIANEHNSIIVFAAGNDNIIARVAPENRTDLTINVAAVDPKIKGTDFTNYGPGSNISAPGESIISSMPGNTYEFSDGTSMAAPIVTGTVALMKSCNPDITVSEVLDILQRTGEYVAAGIPPLIQVDDALIAQTTGVFPDRSAEQEVEVPSDRITRTPAPAPVLAPAPSPSPKPKPRPDAGTDYDAIRELIEAYKKKISELEKLLPENQ